MNINWRRLGVVSLVSLMALSACGSEGEEQVAGEPQELTMLVNITPNLTQEWWEDLVAPYEESSGVDVKIQAPVATNVKESLPQLLASGDVPDVVQTLTPTKDLADQLLDLSDYEFATSGPLAEQYTLDGKYYMAAVGQQLQSIIFYNKQAFSDAGIETPPTTMDELEDAMAALKDAGWTPWQTGGDWFTQVGFQAVGVPTVLGENREWYEQMNTGDITWSESYGDVASRYASWIEKGYIPADAVGIKYEDAEAAFLNGDAAMYPMGSWFGAAEKAAEDKPDIGVFAAPAADGVASPAMGSNAASPYIVMKEASNPEAAVELVEWLTTDDDAVSQQLEVDANFRAGYTYDTDALGEELQEIVEGTPDDAFVPTGDGFGDKAAPAGYQNELNTGVQAMLLDPDPEALGATMDQWWESNRS